MSKPVRFRYSAALAVAGFVAVIGGVPLLAESPLFLPVLLIPIAVAVWAWRAGTDADANGVVLRALFGSRRIAWAQIDTLLTERNRVQAQLANGRFVTLPAVTAADVPRLLEAGGKDLTSTTTETAQEPPQ